MPWPHPTPRSVATSRSLAPPASPSLASAASSPPLVRVSNSRSRSSSTATSSSDSSSVPHKCRLFPGRPTATNSFCHVPPTMTTHRLHREIPRLGHTEDSRFFFAKKKKKIPDSFPRKKRDQFTDEEEEDNLEEEMDDQDLGSEDEEEGGGGGKKRKRPRESLSASGKRGVCYLNRVPQHMNPSHIRQMLSKYGEVPRIYLVPQGQSHRKHATVKAKAYSEGWIEFANKNLAKRVANLLNGEQKDSSLGGGAKASGWGQSNSSTEEGAKASSW